MPKKQPLQPLTPEQQAMLEANLKLIGYMLKRYKPRDEEAAYDRALVSMMRAIRGFKPELGFKFSTYACRGIKNEITRTNQNWRRDRQRCISLEDLSTKSGRRFDPGYIPKDAAEDRDELAKMRRRLNGLNPRWRELLKFRMKGETLDQIGARIGVTKERVRQIEKRALQQMREAMEAA